MDPKHEQTTNEAPMSRPRGASKPEPNPQAEMKIHRAEEDVLGAIQNVENQLGALRKAHEDHRRAMTELNTRKRELEEQAQELDGRENELTSREVELAEMRQDFESRELNLVQRASGLEQRESKIASQAERLEQQEADLERKGADLAGKIDELDKQLAGISARRAELEELEREVQQKLAREDESAKRLEEAIAELEGTRARLGEMDERVSVLGSELAQTREQHKKAADELKTTVSKLRGREIELTERSRALEELAEKAGSIEHELSTTREQYEQQLGEANDRLASEQKVTEGLRAQIEELEQRRAQGDTQLQARIEELTQQLSQAAGSADEALEAERERAGKLKAAAEQLHERLKQAEADRDRLREELDTRPEADPEELAELRTQLQAARQNAEEAGDALARSEESLATLRAQIEAGDSEAAKAHAKVQELEAQASDLFGTIERMGEELEEARSAPRVTSDEWSESRRARLRRMRKILKGDAEKVRRATEALRTRYDQCEQVLTKRAELAEAYEAIAAAQRKYQKREVRSGVVLGLVGMLAITLVLAAGSWFISGRVAPGEYASRVTVAAAGGDQSLAQADLAGWEAYVLELTTDPRFLEVAAERMKRRGIGEFAVPGELAKEMEHSLDVAGGMPGTIVMEYRGQGAERSQRVLDTFAVALASAANNARARRVDSAVTTIEEPASVGEEPLDNIRLHTAGGIFGGGMVLTMIVGGVLWRKLSAAKARFEKDSRVEVLFEEDKWQLPA